MPIRHDKHTWTQAPQSLPQGDLEPTGLAQAHELNRRLVAFESYLEAATGRRSRLGTDIGTVSADNCAGEPQNAAHAFIK